MLVPFLGTVLLFNDAVLNAVRIPEELLSAWGVHIALTPNEASLVRLKLTYFGLCLVGVASFIFTLACPEVVKRYGSAAEFMRGDEPLFTGQRVEAVAGDVIFAFHRQTREEESGREPSFACPRALLVQTYIFLDELATAMLTEDAEAARTHAERFPSAGSADPEPIGETDEERAARWEQEERYFLWKRHAPGADVDKILDLIVNGSRADQGMFYRLRTISRGHAVDVMSVSYSWQSFSRPLIRGSIALIFLAGFALLAVPTVFTFVTVARQTLL